MVGLLSRVNKTMHVKSLAKASHIEAWIKVSYLSLLLSSSLFCSTSQDIGHSDSPQMSQCLKYFYFLKKPLNIDMWSISSFF